MRSGFLRLFLLLFIFLPFSASAIHAWLELGPATAGFMGPSGNNAMVVDAAGNVYVTGEYTDASGKYNVSKWNGTSWSTLGNLNANNSILCLATDAAGNVYAAGKNKNGTPRNNYFVSKWDGISWREVKNDTSYLSANYFIKTMTVDAGGNIYVGGLFSDGATFGKGRPYVVKWDGAKWAKVGNIDSNINPAGNVIYCMTNDAAGNVYIGGYFKDSTGSTCVLKWDGKSWTSLGSLPSTGLNAGQLCTLVADKAGNIYTAGTIANSGGTLYVAKWNGTSWTEVSSAASKLGVPSSRALFSIAVSPNSPDLYAAGYTEKEITNDAYVAHWDGVKWSELGAPPYELNTGTPGGVFALGLDGIGNVYATGDFKNKSNQSYVAKYADYPKLAASSASSTNDDDILVWPMPNKGRFTVTGASWKPGERLYLRISDMLGRTVYSAVVQSTGNSLLVDTRGAQPLIAGIYELQVGSGDRTYAKALVIGD